MVVELVRETDWDDKGTRERIIWMSLVRNLERVEVERGKACSST